MAGFLNVDLPSDDEEDDDFMPDELAQEEKKAKAKTKPKKRRGAANELAQAAAVDEADSDEDEPPAEVKLTTKQIAKKAKIDAIWSQLSGSTGDAAKPSTSQSAAPAPARPSPSQQIDLQKLCTAVNTSQPMKSRPSNPDLHWMRNLGLAKPAASKPPPTAAGDMFGPLFIGLSGHKSFARPPAHTHQQQQQQQEASEAARAVAAAAIAAAKEAAASGFRGANKITIVETRKFAGQDIQVAKQVDKDSKEAQRAAERQKAAAAAAAASGLDAFLAEVEKKKKVNVLDKSKADWQQFKQADASVEEELESYKKSSGQYLDKQDFLKRAELREYELERDKRLAGDVRNRGRL